MATGSYKMNANGTRKATVQGVMGALNTAGHKRAERANHDARNGRHITSGYTVSKLFRPVDGYTICLEYVTSAAIPAHIITAPEKREAILRGYTEALVAAGFDAVYDPRPQMVKVR